MASKAAVGHLVHQAIVHHAIGHALEQHARVLAQGHGTVSGTDPGGTMHLAGGGPHVNQDQHGGFGGGGPHVNQGQHRGGGGGGFGSGVNKVAAGATAHPYEVPNGPYTVPSGGLNLDVGQKEPNYAAYLLDVAGHDTSQGAPYTVPAGAPAFAGQHFPNYAAYLSAFLHNPTGATATTPPTGGTVQPDKFQQVKMKNTGRTPTGRLTREANRRSRINISPGTRATGRGASQQVHSGPVKRKY